MSPMSPMSRMSPMSVVVPRDIGARDVPPMSRQCRADVAPKSPMRGSALHGLYSPFGRKVLINARPNSRPRRDIGADVTPMSAMPADVADVAKRRVAPSARK
jgi:hypothetical protein